MDVDCSINMFINIQFYHQSLDSTAPRLACQQGSFAALRLDGSVVTWGIPRSGGDSADVQDQCAGLQSVFFARGALQN
jgi:hypothetical protein